MADSDVPTFDDLANDLVETPDVKEESVETPETTEAESSTEETKDSEQAEVQKAEDTETEEADTPAELEEVVEGPETPKPSKADERKQQLNGEIRDLVSQRRDLMAEVERLNSQVYAPQSVDDIIAETGQTPVEARMTALEQQRELDRFNTQVAEAQLVIGSESERVLQDFPMFNPDSSEYNADVAGQAAELLRSNLKIDDNTGQIIGSSISPYKLYKTIASANQASAVENQLKGQKAAERQLAAVEPQSSAVPKQPKVDPFLSGLIGGENYKRLREAD